MTVQVVNVSHVNVTVPAEVAAAARHFYEVVLGLRQIPKPPGPRQFIGAWFAAGPTQIHLSLAESADNRASDRHVCYQVADLAAAKLHLEEAGIAIVKDEVARFFVRDPGDNLIEITAGSGARD